jgi:NEDD4-binding protein 2
MANKPICLIMRGASGAGKDWWIRRHVVPSAVIVSADDFFMKDGHYEFDRERLPEAHDMCLRTFLAAIERRAELIIVNNTNTRVWELAPYYRVAEAAGYDVEIIWLIADPLTCFGRSRHNVAAEVIQQMITGVDSLPPWWQVSLITNTQDEPAEAVL